MLRAALTALSVTGLFVTLWWWFICDNGLSNIVPHKPNQALLRLIRHTNTQSVLMMAFFYELVGDVICRLGNVLLLPSKASPCLSVCLWWLLCSVMWSRARTRRTDLCVCVWSLIYPRWALNVIHTAMTTDAALLSELELTGLQNKSVSMRHKIWPTNSDVEFGMYWSFKAWMWGGLCVLCSQCETLAGTWCYLGIWTSRGASSVWKESKDNTADYRNSKQLLWWYYQ